MTIDEPDFFLASCESHQLENPRRCKVIRSVKTQSRDDLQLIQVDPPIVGQNYGLGACDIDIVLIAARYREDSVLTVEKWPVFVHVARLLVDAEACDVLGEEDYESIAWAELYETENDAKIKKMN